MVVGIQGERGSFSEEAAFKLFSATPEIQCCEHFEDVFRRTVDAEFDYCVIPIENSLTGSIYKNYDLLRRYGLRIVREVSLRIRHHLIVLKGTPFEAIVTVMSHPVALDQCESFFGRFRHLEKRTAYDTSGSVKCIVEGGMRDCAAIAGENAAQFFGGRILMRGIEDNKENFTRFFLLSLEMETVDGADKTSIVFSFKNSPGSLFKCLSVFAQRGIDLTKIESRPIRGRPWEYIFYIDFLGDLADERCANALDHLSEITEFVEVLGCYPRDSSHRKTAM